MTIPSMISTLLPSGHSISSQKRTRSSHLWPGSSLTATTVMAVLPSVPHRSHHAERDRWRSTGPVHPYGACPTPASGPRAGQAIRSRTTGAAVKDVPGAAMS
ncbi:hypothetical protein SHIRM173S_05976 [Streptomyces hirsutus]